MAELTGVHHLHFSISEPDTVFAFTDDGLYAVSFDGQRLEQRFHFSSEEGVRGLILKEGPRGLYLGTTHGVYFQAYSERNWTRLRGVMNDEPVLDIRSVSGVMFFLTTESLVRLDESGYGFQDVFHFPGYEKDEGETEAEGDDAVLAEAAEAAMDVGGGRIFLAVNGGLFISSDLGESWERSIPGTSFPDDVFSLMMNAAEDYQTEEPCDNIWVGTRNGVYVCSDGHWQMLRAGWEGSRVNDVLMTKTGMVYAATDQGLFSIGGEVELFGGKGARGASLATEATDLLATDAAPVTPNIPQTREDQAAITWVDLEVELSREPSIQNVQRWAIDYAEVSNGKIQSWRHLAKKRALFPRLSVSTGNDQSRTISDSMYGSSTNGGSHYMAPDSKNYRQNIDF